jgi:hypothetical protein
MIRKNGSRFSEKIMLYQLLAALYRAAPRKRAS